MIARGKPDLDRAGRLDERREVAQRAPVYLAFEVHYVVGGIPEIHPTPDIELGGGMGIQAECRIAVQHPEQEPYLLLADTGRPLAAPHVT